MNKKLYINGKEIEYEMQYKKVKNINLRIRRDGTVFVSANRKISQRVIEEFMLSKSEFILKALHSFENKADSQPVQYFSEAEIKDTVIEICERVYPYFEKRGVEYPQIKFRKMVSRWGTCHTVKKILTFNINLMYTPLECVEYVVLHEFTHFLVANHSPRFYDELSKKCPQWKECRKKLKNTALPQ